MASFLLCWMSILWRQAFHIRAVVCHLEVWKTMRIGTKYHHDIYDIFLEDCVPFVSGLNIIRGHEFKSRTQGHTHFGHVSLPLKIYPCGTPNLRFAKNPEYSVTNSFPDLKGPLRLTAKRRSYFAQIVLEMVRGLVMVRLLPSRLLIRFVKLLCHFIGRVPFYQWFQSMTFLRGTPFESPVDINSIQYSVTMLSNHSQILDVHEQRITPWSYRLLTIWSRPPFETIEPLGMTAGSLRIRFYEYQPLMAGELMWRLSWCNGATLVSNRFFTGSILQETQ